MERHNPFWRNTRTEKHFADPVSDPPPTPAPVPNKLTCEFCGCELSKNGDVLRRGEAATKFLKHDDVIAEKDREIARLNSELADVKRERDALAASQASSGGSSSGHRPGARIT